MLHTYTDMKLNKFHNYCGIPQKPWFYLLLLPASHVKCLQWDILIHTKQKQNNFFLFSYGRESRTGCWKVRDGRKKRNEFSIYIDVFCCTLNTKGASEWESERSHKTPLNICFEAEKVLWKSVSMDSFFKSAAGGQYKATWFHKYFISNIKLPQVFVLRIMLFLLDVGDTELYWLY